MLSFLLTNFKVKPDLTFPTRNFHDKRTKKNFVHKLGKLWNFMLNAMLSHNLRRRGNTM